MSDLALAVRITGNTTSLSAALKASAQETRQWGERLQAVGRTLSAALTVPIVGVGVASTKMAADAVEAANKFDVVMGDSADRVRERLEELHQTIPLTRHEMEALAAGIQDMLVPMGLARPVAADMSAAMVELAGDLASFNNVGTAEALEALRSGLAGESEPLRRFGVDVREARLQAIALETGLIDTAAAFDETARAQAIFLAVQRDSKDAIGDAARTANEAANSFRFFWREAKELSVVIGEILLPVVTPMVQHMTEGLKLFQALPGPVQKIAVAVGALAAVVGPVALAIGTVMAALPITVAAAATAIKAALLATVGPVGLTVAAVGALAAVGVVMVRNWDVVKLRFALIWATIKDAVFSAVDGIIGAIETLYGWIPGLGDKIRGLRDRFNDFADHSLARSNDQLLRLEREIAQNFTPAAEGASAALEQLKSALAGLGTEGGGAGRVLTSTLTDTARQLAEAVELGVATRDEWSRLLELESQLNDRLRAGNATLQDRLEIARALAKISDITTRPIRTDLSRSVGPATPAAVPIEVPAQKAADAEFMIRLKFAALDAAGAVRDFAGRALGGAKDAALSLLNAFNPLAMLATVFDEALRSVTRAMEPLLDAIEPLVAGLADALTPVIEALAPVIQKLTPVIVALAQAIAPILLAVVPLLEQLVPPLRLLARVASYVVQALGIFIEALGRFVDKIVPDFISEAGQGLARLGQEMQDGAKAARRSLDEGLQGTAALGKAARDAAEQLHNIPSGFKVALARFNATRPSAATPPTGGAAGGGGGSVGGGTGGVRRTESGDSYHIEIREASDPRETARQVVRAIRQRKGLGGASDFDLAMEGA